MAADYSPEKSAAVDPAVVVAVAAAAGPGHVGHLTSSVAALVVDVASQVDVAALFLAAR